MVSVLTRAEMVWRKALIEILWQFFSQCSDLLSMWFNQVVQWRECYNNLLFWCVSYRNSNLTLTSVIIISAKNMQHGPDECLLNTVEACAIRVWPDLVTDDWSKLNAVHKISSSNVLDWICMLAFNLISDAGSTFQLQIHKMRRTTSSGEQAQWLEILFWKRGVEFKTAYRLLQHWTWVWS